MTGAGVVNAEGRDQDEAFSALVIDSPEPVRHVAAALRDLVYDVLPGTVEVVWPRQRTVGWGVGPRKFTEQFAYLLLGSAYVSLGFYHGGELVDPHQLLPSKGGHQVRGSLSMRSLRLATSDDLGPALRDLLAEAVRHQQRLLDG